MASNKVVKFKKGNPTAKVLFTCILVYVVIFAILTMSKKTIKTYEVQAGSLSADNIYSGIIFRNEYVENATFSGNINYYIKEGTKAKVNDAVYSVDETGRVATLLADMNREDNSLPAQDVKSIKSEINKFKTNYNKMNFSNVYDLKTNLDNIVLRAINESLLANIDKLIEETGSTNLFKTIKTDKSGLIVYGIDGYETVTASNFKADMLKKENYENKNLYNEDIVVAGNPVYKIITDDSWEIVFPMTKDDIDSSSLTNGDVVSIRFKKNRITAQARFDYLKTDEGTFGKLTLSNYQVLFAKDRFIDFELITSTTEGLKIPTSSITTMNFFKIPVKYLTAGGNSNDDGFLTEYYKEDGSKVTEFKACDIYYKDDNFCYVHPDALKSGTSLLMTNSSESYIIGEKAPLDGVFCANTGYTVFKRIVILDKNKEYCIVKKGVSYSISLYDRIVLDSEGIKEGSMIY